MARFEPDPTTLRLAHSLFILIIFLACAITLPTLGGCSREAGGSTRPDERPNAPVEQARHQLVVAEPVDFRMSWQINGVLEPAATARAAFLVGGRLTKVLVERGEQVTQGQPLAHLDTAEVRAGVAQTKAAVAAADAQVRMAEDALGRLEPLSQQEAIAGAQVVKVRLQLEAARAMRDQARAAVAMARVKLDQHTIHAPIPGTVLDVPENLGEIVGPGLPQFEIADLSRLKLVGTLPAEAAGQIREGQPVKIRPQSGDPLEGRISSVLPALTADTHRLPIEVEIDAPTDRPALANSYVEIEVVSFSTIPAASIPSTAVVREDENWVFVVEGGLARRRQVRVLSNQGDHLVIQGMTPGSQVIDIPGVDLTDGAPVRP